MNDLFVDESARGQGVGRALIEASAAVARERGAAHLEWSTAPTTSPPSASTTRQEPSAPSGSSTSSGFDGDENCIRHVIGVKCRSRRGSSWDENQKASLCFEPQL